MPKSTFLNLTKEKRQRIIDIAVNEFCRYSYHKASISRIVENAKIAKGSFYQYFKNKKDLYKYIIKINGEKKMQYLNKALVNFEDMNFFEIVRNLYIAGIKFHKANPKLSSIGNDFIKNADSQLREEIFGDNIPKSNKFFENLLIKGIQKGEVREDIDVKLVSHLITTLSISTSEYFFNEVKVADDIEIMNIIDKMLDVIEKGIKKEKEEY